MAQPQLYDSIGAGYPATRRTEPRIAAQIWAALGDAQTVLNVGAGTGSYEPPDRHVTAVEPSTLMRAQRPAGAAACVAASADNLPFDDQSFDAAWGHRFWLIRDCLPEVAEQFAGWPPLARLAEAIEARAETVLIPWDCSDGCFEAYWRRPEAYLDHQVRRGMSVWTTVGPAAEQRAVHSLQHDLASGAWAERHRDLLHREAADLGLRLLIA